ncbi:MAG: ABC transporter permease [Bacilli bacterium]|nr:ABC transporter permease [Bacilli bacterium]
MLFKLSTKNIKKSIKDYAIYFFTLVLGVAIFYVFNAIDSSAAMMKVGSIQLEIIKMLGSMLSGISVFVSFVLGFLIIYASQFLIKRRKKEFGIYMILGMGKKELSKILLIETLLIGILSLVVGLILGVLASQFMSIFVAGMFEADMNKFVFTFSSEAMIKTLIFFAIIYLFVMFFNAFSVSKCKLINLLNAAKQSEKVKVKNSAISIILFILSIVMLAYAYYTVTSKGLSIGINQLGVMIFIGCIATFLFFYSFSGLLLKLVQSNKHLYFKKLNMFVVRQLNSKVNTTVISMSIISIMLFLTICILSSGLSIKNMLDEQLQGATPVDINVSQIINIDSNSNYYALIDDAGNPLYTERDLELSKQTVVNNLSLIGFDTSKNLKDVFEYKKYALNDITLKSTLGNNEKEVKEALLEDYQFLNLDSKEVLMKISDYNKVAELYGQKKLSVNENEYIILCDYDNMKDIRNRGLKNHCKIHIDGKEYSPKYESCQSGFTQISTSNTNAGIILLPDDALDDQYAYSRELVANYNAKGQEGLDKIENRLMDKDKIDSYVINELSRIHFSINTKASLYAASVGIGAIGTFIGIYLGIIFLISSAAILALKELSDSSDNKERYTVLRKIGVDEQMINKALFIQIGIFFLLPVALAVVHSIFGIQFCISILQTLGKTGLLPSILMTASFVTLIYGGYFLITYFCSKKIIREK